jgi:indolepyruvate ferredoxin oxidoreductase
VARLYTDGRFRRALEETFEGKLRLSFHMAPPLLVKSRNGAPPSKVRYGPWLLGAMKWLARGKFLRGTWFDPFGHTAERRMERALAAAYAQQMEALLPRLSSDTLGDAVALAALADQIRGFGHVKLASLRTVLAREARLCTRLGLAPRLADAVPQAARLAVSGQTLKDIPVVTGR